jgi:hypothetical protein
LEDYMAAYHMSVMFNQAQRVQGEGCGSVPAGSLRWERFVRSSLASSIVGFIRGGRRGSSPLCRASTETSMVFDWSNPHVRQLVIRIIARGPEVREHTSPFSSWKTRLAFSPLIVLLTSSDATQPSAASGCHALVPTS